MIVQTDFLDHWKTQMLIDLLGDTHAPLYMIRLWGYCQTKKTHRFPVGSASVLKAICRAPCEPEKFESALISSGFLEKTDGFWEVHDWNVANYQLIQSWENGKKGGRPSVKTQGKPKGNPRDSQDKPTANLSDSQDEPIRLDKRREEKRRKEEEEEASSSSSPSAFPLGEILEGLHGDLGTLSGARKAILLFNPAWTTGEASVVIENLLKNCSDPARRRKGVQDFLSELALGNTKPAKFPKNMLSAYMTTAAQSTASFTDSTKDPYLYAIS